MVERLEEAAKEEKKEDEEEKDDDLKLPADTLAILEAFRREQQAAETSADRVEEDWQLSQFWYSADTALRLARECIRAVIAESGDEPKKVACVSAPTLLPFLKQLPEVESGRVSVKLFEFDERFAVKHPDEFALFDYRTPLALPVDLVGAFDLVIADPPFLSDECLVKTAQSIRRLGKPQAKIIVCTGVIMEDMVSRLLGARRLSFRPQHEKNLANDFACYANYEAEGLREEGEESTEAVGH